MGVWVYGCIEDEGERVCELYERYGGRDGVSGYMDVWGMYGEGKCCMRCMRGVWGGTGEVG